LRNDIPPVLCSLQDIYTTPGLRERVFTLLAEVIPASTRDGREGPADACTGRPGMEAWKPLVLGTLRLGLNNQYPAVGEQKA